MKCRASLLLLSLANVLFAQTAPASKAREPILKNPRVTVSAIEVSAHTVIVAGKHDHDLITVIVGDRAKSNLAPGNVFFTPANSVERNRNNGDLDLPAVRVEFPAPQGPIDRKSRASTRYCNPGSKTACVSEKYLFCTTKLCVEDVRMGTGAVSTKHSHDTDHMIIAVTDYALSDDVVGKGIVTRNVKSGGVEYIPAGIEHTLTNKSPGEIRFVVVVFR